MQDGSNARTASLLFLLQLGSRAITFALNQALLSLTSPAAFGTATIQLEPLLNTVLFLTREGIRNALLRSYDRSTISQKVVKLSVIPLLFGIFVATGFFGFYASRISADVATQPFFKHTVALYALATCVELASEPYFNRALISNDVKLRVSIEGSAVIARAITTLLTILYGREKYTLLAFGVGQLIYALTILLRYAVYHARSALTTSNAPSQSNDANVLKLALALTRQSLVKQMLTEGDKLIVSRISPIQDQAAYGLALNYGSLITRILFQPLEESSRIFYSQRAGSLSSARPPVKADLSEKLTNAQQSMDLLGDLVRFQLYLALIFVCFCPFYTTPLLHTLLGRSRWMQTSAPSLLRKYLFLLPFLGINGVLEAFVQAVADRSQLDGMSWALMLWSLMYCATTYVGVSFFGLKEDALILANAVSMACRISYSIVFIDAYARQHALTNKLRAQIKRVRPTATTAVMSSIILSMVYRQTQWKGVIGFFQLIAAGATAFALCLGVAYRQEAEYCALIMSKVLGRFKKKVT